MCGSFPLQNHAQRWWDLMKLIERVKQKQEQNKTKIEEKLHQKKKT